MKPPVKIFESGRDSPHVGRTALMISRMENVCQPEGGQKIKSGKGKGGRWCGRSKKV
jgi:hypothetical protein